MNRPVSFLLTLIAVTTLFTGKARAEDAAPSSASSLPSEVVSAPSEAPSKAPFLGLFYEEKKGSGITYDPKFDLGVTVVSFGTFLGLDLGGSAFMPATCRWCDTHLNGMDSGARDAFKWKNTKRAGMLSNVAFAFIPLTVGGITIIAADHDNRLQEVPADGLLIVEAASIAGAINSATKIMSARLRPEARFDTTPPKKLKADKMASFGSGHTTLAFAGVVSAGTIAGMRGYELAPWIWAVGLPVAVATGYFRIAADKHYLSDVLMGAAIGAGTGFAVPYLFHRERPDGLRGTIQAAPLPGGFMFAYQRDL